MFEVDCTFDLPMTMTKLGHILTS